MTVSAVRPPASRAPRALVVDDEPAIRRVLRRCLERAGWTVAEAGDGGEAASRLCATGEWDLVICDLNLPDRTGLELRREALARAPYLAERFVVCTGESALGGGTMSGSEARELATGGRLLAKPFTLEDVGSLLRRVTPAAAA